jgi:hypothetical protein
MQAAVPQLHARHREAVAREKAAAWVVEFSRVATKYNALADEWRNAYPPLLDKLIDLCTRANALTLEIDRINGTAPSGEGRRMPRMWNGGKLRLPHLFDDSEQVAWPPPTPPVFVSCLVPPGPGADWLAELKARDAARHEASLRVIANLNERARERQERELKEGKEAIAREVAERNRRNGWPC